MWKSTFFQFLIRNVLTDITLKKTIALCSLMDLKAHEQPFSSWTDFNQISGYISNIHREKCIQNIITFMVRLKREPRKEKRKNFLLVRSKASSAGLNEYFSFNRIHGFWRRIANFREFSNKTCPILFSPDFRRLIT